MNIESFNNKYWISVSGKRGTLYGYSYGLKKRDLIVNNDEIYYIEHIEYERNPRNMFRANVVMIGRSDGIIVNEGDSLNDIIKRLTFNKINNVSNL